MGRSLRARCAFDSAGEELHEHRQSSATAASRNLERGAKAVLELRPAPRKVDSDQLRPHQIRHPYRPRRERHGHDAEEEDGEELVHGSRAPSRPRECAAFDLLTFSAPEVFSPLQLKAIRFAALWSRAGMPLRLIASHPKRAVPDNEKDANAPRSSSCTKHVFASCLRWRTRSLNPNRVRNPPLNTLIWHQSMAIGALRSPCLPNKEPRLET